MFGVIVKSKPVELPKGVKRITFIEPFQVTPTAEPMDVIEQHRRKKKTSRGLRAIEKLTRRYAVAMREFSGTYLARHDRSNRKKRDGWLRDYLFNLARANKQALNKLRIPVLKL